MIRVRPDGSIETDTVEEALALRTQILAARSSSEGSAPPPIVTTPTSFRRQPFSPPPPGAVYIAVTARAVPYPWESHQLPCAAVLDRGLGHKTLSRCGSRAGRAIDIGDRRVPVCGTHAKRGWCWGKLLVVEGADAAGATPRASWLKQQGIDVTRARVGRPPKLTTEVQQQILEALRGGATPKEAATGAGVSYGTYRRHLAARLDGNSEHAAFGAAVLEAKRAGDRMRAARASAALVPAPVIPVAAAPAVAPAAPAPVIVCTAQTVTPPSPAAPPSLPLPALDTEEVIADELDFDAPPPPRPAGPIPPLPDVTGMQLWEKQIAWCAAAKGGNQRAAALLLDSIQGSIWQAIHRQRRAAQGRGAPLNEADLEDMHSAAQIAVIRHAIPKFEPERGFRFLTYAEWWFKAASARWVEDYKLTIKIPFHLLHAKGPIARARRRLRIELGRAPTVEEIAKASGIAASRIRRLNEAGYVSQSLDAPAAANRGDSDTALIDLVADPARTAEDELVASADTEVLRGIIAELPPGQRDAIEGRLAGKTLAEIGAARGVTRERIRQLEFQAFMRIRDALRRAGYQIPKLEWEAA